MNFNLFSKLQRKKIFTFWEPKAKMPGYIRLCIKTWKKLLDDYEIIILDYKKVKEFLGERLFNSIICKKFTFKVQSDAIRIALLNKFGGIWMDADTIILNKEFLNRLNNFELVMIGDKATLHIGFIFASKKSRVINEWLNKIINKVSYYKNISKGFNKGVSWNYLGNGIVNGLINNISSKEFFRLNKHEIIAFPELKFLKNDSLSAFSKYRLFYFQKGNPKPLFENVKGIIMLHNTWTPFKYKLMSEKQFLSQDILISKLLSQILNITA